MSVFEAFRDPHAAQQLASAIRQAADPQRQYRLMEFCGGHTHAIFRYGIPDLLPANINFIHGPGCPVCVLPMARLDQAIALASQQPVILCCYADVLRVPASGRRSLLSAKADGADIRRVQSSLEALAIARANPQQAVVFFAIGFETTTPATAVAIQQAAQAGLDNFSVLCNHVLTPAAMQAILQTAQPVAIDGFLGPSHVSTIIGSQPYQVFASHHRKPVVIAGFEPVDVLQATLMLIQQLNSGRCSVENQYRRAVTDSGNRKAQALMAAVFTLREQFEWRGLGWLPHSALQIAPTYAAFDAEQRFSIATTPSQAIKGCECPAILRGSKRPTDCRLLGTVCTPQTPMGACMVSSEGACAAYWSYGRQRASQRNSASDHA